MVKKGYKQTEVGVIPEDWEVDTFKNVGAFFKGAGISMKDTRPTGLPCIMYGDIYVKYDTHFKKCDFRIDISTALKSSKAIQNDLLFTASGETAEEIGKCVSYQGNVNIYIGGDIIAIRPSSKYDSLFLSYVQNSVSLIKQKATLAQGHTVVHINKQNIESLRFVCPPLPEQHRIAKALSDMDSMISSLEKLIAKYKSIKAACLQQMFPQNGETVPRMRLPGFTDAWEQRKLGELVDVCSGRDYKHLSEGTIPVYGTGGYMLSVNDALSYDRDAIGIGRKGTIDRPYILKAPFWTVDTLFYAIPREKVDLNYAFDIFQNIDWKKKDESTGVPSLSKTAINDIDVLAPKHNEQQTIGLFFADLDHLITLHQRKLKKVQKIKQGMMQQLLTGKIRLV